MTTALTGLESAAIFISKKAPELGETEHNQIQRISTVVEKRITAIEAEWTNWEAQISERRMKQEKELKSPTSDFEPKKRGEARRRRDLSFRMQERQSRDASKSDTYAANLQREEDTLATLTIMKGKGRGWLCLDHDDFYASTMTPCFRCIKIKA